MSRARDLLGCAVVVSVLCLGPVARPAAGADCPTRVTFEPTGAAAVDAGWRGLAHDRAMLGSTLDFAIDCVPSTPPCGTCAITGLAPTPAQPRRCTNDTSIVCSPATEVTDCGADDRCRTFLSPPQSVAIGGIPLCFTTTVAGSVSGTVDVESGAIAPAVPVRVEVYSGLGGSLGGANQGCPRCAGDPTLDDGVRGGVCDGGARTGQSCDADAVSVIPDYGAASFDCPPSPGAIVSQFNFAPLASSTAGGIVTLAATSPNCWGKPGAKCFCDTCNSAAAEACMSNVDCPLSGGNPGICGGERCLGGPSNGTPCATTSECPGGGLCGRPGEPTRPNACLDDTTVPSSCVPVGDAGTCSAGPVQTVCSNHPNRGCVTDAHCDGVPGACVAENYPCFPDNGVIGGNVSVTGTATPPVGGVADPTDLGLLGCVPAGGSSQLNNIGGFPGLLRVHQPGRLEFDRPTPAPTPSPAPTTLPGFCPPVPATCKLPVQAHKASVQLTDGSPDDRDRLTWKWLKGEASGFGDFGDPVTSDDYALCLYDASGLRMSVAIPAGRTCLGKPCWQQLSSGFRYRNKNADPDGLTQLRLKLGVDGKAQIQAQARGALLPLPALPSLTTALTVQLRNKTSGVCWGTTFSLPFERSTATTLKDHAD